ncbi:MAG: glycosyltransferase family 2 protein [Nitrospirae bacterium]|nr:MAG: glycosyltransferase family 2 protein [Nitrospirota bacterium]
MLISFVIPAFNAMDSVGGTLDSVFVQKLPEDWELEAIVVDDGSTDGVVLEEVVGRYPGAKLLRHAANRGMCAARNTGIRASQGSLVIILDADDELVSGWPYVLSEILDQWPRECSLCFAACHNQRGTVTAEEPDYCGYLNLDDLLNERHSGEYLPIFRGEYIRAKGYSDLGMRKSCGIVSYLKFAHDGPFWISNKVLRIYHENRSGSVTSSWSSPTKAAETARCYKVLLEQYGELYRKRAPRVYHTKWLRLAIYLRLAHLPGAWRAYRKGVGMDVWVESVGAGILLILGGKMAGVLASLLKRLGMIRRYG